MMTRRAFVKDGASPSVARPDAAVSRPDRAGCRAAPAETPCRHLPARRRRRAQHGRALRRVRLLPRAALHRGRAARTQRRCHRSGRLLRPPSAVGTASPLWHRSHLAIVHACGSPDLTRSHFDAQDYMESGTPGVKSTGDGWLNRYLAGALRRRKRLRSGPCRCRTQMPRIAAGPAPALAIAQLTLRIRGGIATRSVGASFEAEYAAAADQVLTGTGHEAFEPSGCSRRRIRRSYAPSNGAEYPASAFGQALRQIAQLIKAEVGLEVAFAEVGGWDTHVDQGGATGQLADTPRRLRRGARGARHRLGPLARRRHRDDVGVRPGGGRERVRGTDHGHGNAMMIVGGRVRGGSVYGQWPGLGRDAALRRPRSAGHDRLPLGLHGNRVGPPRRREHQSGVPRIRSPAGQPPRYHRIAKSDWVGPSGSGVKNWEGPTLKARPPIALAIRCHDAATPVCTFAAGPARSPGARMGGPDERRSAKSISGATASHESSWHEG